MVSRAWPNSGPSARSRASRIVPRVRRDQFELDPDNEKVGVTADVVKSLAVERELDESREGALVLKSHSVERQDLADIA